MSYFSILEDASLGDATVWSFMLSFKFLYLNGDRPVLYIYGRSKDPQPEDQQLFEFLFRTSTISNRTHGLPTVLCVCVCTTMDGSTTMVVKVFQSHFPETIDPYHFSNTLITPLSAPTTPKLHIKYPFLRNSQVLTPQISISQKSLLQFPFFQKHVEDAQVKVVPFLQP